MQTRTQSQGEFGQAATSLYGQGGALVAMAACNLMLLLMFVA